MLESKFHCLIAVLDYWRLDRLNAALARTSFAMLTLAKIRCLGFWRFTSFVFRYDFAKAKSALHQLVHRDVARLLRNRRTCQNPLSWIIGGSTGSTQLSPRRVSVRSLLPKSKNNIPR